MKDTTPEILKKQLEIFLSKTESERFRIGNELNDFGREVIESTIRQEHPDIQKPELKIEVFRRCYSTFYAADEMEKIVHSMREYWKSQPRSVRMTPQ